MSNYYEIEITPKTFSRTFPEEFAELVAGVCELRGSIYYEIEIFKALLQQIAPEDQAELLEACGLRWDEVQK